MKWGHLSGLERVDAVYEPPIRAGDEVEPGEWCQVLAGWCLVIWSPVLVVDGVLRLNGVVLVDPTEKG